MQGAFQHARRFRFHAPIIVSASLRRTAFAVRLHQILPAFPGGIRIIESDHHHCATQLCYSALALEDSSDRQRRQTDFQRWIQDVRDPATCNTEGRRKMVVDGARAMYEIAPLSCDRWAIHCTWDYSCGNCHSSAMPWREFETRDACVREFVRRARLHFGMLSQSDSCVSEKQKQIQRAMAAIFTPGLFGFVEPEPES